MADIIWADVVGLQASLSTVPVATQDLFLSYVNTELNPNLFGDSTTIRFKLARMYLAAHLGEVARSNGAGQIASKMIDTSRIAITYVASSASDEALKQTIWGEQYLELLMQSPLRIGAGLCR